MCLKEQLIHTTCGSAFAVPTHIHVLCNEYKFSSMSQHRIFNAVLRCKAFRAFCALHAAERNGHNNERKPKKEIKAFRIGCHASARE